LVFGDEIADWRYVEFLVIGLKRRQAPKPAEDFVTAEPTGPGGLQGGEGAVRPGAKIGHEPMVLGVSVDITDQVEQMPIRFNANAFEGPLEQTAAAAMGLIDCLGVSIEAVREPLGIGRIQT
jgi:hypothetical protein